MLMLGYTHAALKNLHSKLCSQKQYFQNVFGNRISKKLHNSAVKSNNKMSKLYEQNKKQENY